MTSLTPHSRNAEATAAAMEEGLLSGAMVLVPSAGLVYYLTHNVPRFAARTNMQSRTALAIMPALFMFAFTAETHLSHKMHEIAKETEHSHASVRWAEEQLAKQKQQQQQQQLPSLPSSSNNNKTDAETQLLTSLYKQSVEQSGVQIVPGDTLTLYQRTANFVTANPLKVVLGLAAPSVALIFYGRTGKEHLQLSMKLLHTRVFGQFATLSLLLGVMGFKEYMDRQGKYITQAEADLRVAQMQHTRQVLLDRLEYERQQAQAQKARIAAAHQQDAADHKKHKASQSS